MARRCTSRTATPVLVALLITCLCAGAASGEIVIQIGTVEAAPGAIVALPVTLHTDGEPLSGIQTDLLFAPEITPLGRDEWRADCSQNVDLLPGELGVQASVSDFCADGTACIRATASLSSETFPSGSVVLYTCAVQVAHDAASGSYAVRCSNFGTSTQDGEELPANCADGAIVVAGDPVEITPSPVPTPTNAPTSQGPPVLEVADLSGNPGDRLTIEFRLRIGEVPIAGLQVDISFPTAARIAARANGRPDCAFGREPNFAGYSSITFQPPGCSVADCPGMRAFLISTELVPIPDGTLLMSCNVDIAPDAARGVYAFSLSYLVASTPAGDEVPLDANPGTISVSAEPLAEPSVGVQQPATPTPTPELQPNGSQGEQPISGVASSSAVSSGCAIAPGHQSLGRWEFLIVIALLALSRRRR